MNKFSTLAPLLAVAILSMPTAALASCNIDGASGNTSPVYVSDMAKPFHGTLCGHSVYGPNCTIIVDVDGTRTNNVDCLTLGGGVTLQGSVGGGPATISCTGTLCSRAISILDNNSTGSVVIKNIDIEGCFTNGVVGYISNNKKYQDSYVDLAPLAGSCLNSRTAVDNLDTIDGVSIRNASVGVRALSGQNVNNSVITGTEKAVLSETGSSTAASVTNCSIYDNDYSVYIGYTSVAQSVNVTGTSFVNANVCHQGRYSAGCVSNAINFTGAASFLDYVIK